MKHSIITLIGLLALACIPSLRAVPQEQPNILFILIDDQRNDTLGCAGHPVIQTPTIDRLAAEGVRFENAFVTTPICMTSRATIFTGLYQRTHGYRPNDPAGSSALTDPMLERSFPPLLRQAGYYTGYYGKNHVVYQRGTGNAFNLMFDQWEHIGRSPYFKTMPDGSKRHSAELIGDRSVKFLKERPVDKPFFLYMSFNIAHAEDGDHRPGIGHFPWPKSVDGLYEDITPRPPLLDDPEYFEVLPDFLKHSLNRVRWKWRWDTLEKYNTNMRAYYRMLTGMDRIVQRVQDEIERQGLSENTVVIYTADNGYYMGDRGFAGKWSHFEESLRVPMIVFDPRLPEAKRGRVVPQMALNLDVPSTILDVAGLSIPDAYQGMSLMSVVRDEFSASEGKAAWREGFFCEHHQYAHVIPGWSGFREGRFKYARYDRLNPPFEFLHDLERDPTELKNLASDPEYQEVLERLRERTDQAIKEYGGSQPGAQSQGEIKIPSAPSKVIVFDGKQYGKIKDMPALSVDDSMIWRMDIKVDRNCPPGAVLMGNRRTSGRDVFLKITPSKGVQLYQNGRHLFRIPATLPRGEWTAVKLVKEGPQFTFYINGKVAGQATVSQPVPAMPCYLGGDPLVTNEFAKCSIRNASVGAP